MQAWSQELAPRPGLPHSLVGYLEAGTPCLRKPVGADGVWSPVSPRQRGRGAVTAGCGATPASKTQPAGMGPSWCPQGLCGLQQGAGGVEPMPGPAQRSRPDRASWQPLRPQKEARIDSHEASQTEGPCVSWAMIGVTM